MKKTRFYICEHCGNIIGKIHDAGVPLICCGQKMTELVPGTVEASHEKHIPVVTVDADTVRVTVGSVAHPMTEEHHIAWVYLETEKGGQRKALPIDGEPTVEFVCKDDNPLCVYAYCNLHGLWAAEI